MPAPLQSTVTSELQLLNVTVITFNASAFQEKLRAAVLNYTGPVANVSISNITTTSGGASVLTNSVTFVGPNAGSDAASWVSALSNNSTAIFGSDVSVVPGSVKVQQYSSSTPAPAARSSAPQPVQISLGLTLAALVLLSSLQG
jgi:hypothetical protein